MINTMETAIDLVTSKLDVVDLIEDVQFLNDIDNSLKKLLDNELYSGVQIANTRKKIINKIAALKEQEEVLEEED